jgi:hypothetical protein
MELRIIYGRHPDPTLAEWKECPEETATLFCVAAADDDEELEVFSLKSEAEAFIQGFRAGFRRGEERGLSQG